MHHLTLSVTIMVVFFHGGKWEPTWSSRAAEEVEAVAAIPCSGHGRAFLDGLALNGMIEPVFECNQFYSGSDCSKFLSDCAVINLVLKVFLTKKKTYELLTPSKNLSCYLKLREMKFTLF